MCPDQMFAGTSAGILLFDDAFRIIWANQIFGGYFGLAPEDFLGRRGDHVIDELLVQDLADPRALARALSCSREKESFVDALDHRVLPSESRPERWLSYRSFLCREGALSGKRVGYFQDITQIKNLEGNAPERQVFVTEENADLMQVNDCSYPWYSSTCGSPITSSRNRYTNATCRDTSGFLVENIDVGILVVDSDYTILVANQSGERLFDGMGKLTGQRCYQIMAGRNSPCSECPGALVLEGAQVGAKEIERTIHGKRRILSARAFSLPSSEPGFTLVLEDITVRKQVEHSLREAALESECARDRIDSIIRSVLDGLVVTDPMGRIVLINGAAEAILQLKQTQLFQSSLEDCITERRLLHRLQAALRNGEDGARFEYELPGQKGVRTLTVSISQVRNRDGISQGTVFLLRDITRERELDRMKSEFISTAAHELRTPLTSIMGFSELLLTRHDLSSEQKNDFLSFIHRKAENLSHIISDLLDISRIEAGRGLELNREACDLIRLIRETALGYCNTSDKHRLEIDIPPGPLMLNIDEGKVIQVLENLLSNAIKYSPSGGSVRLSVGPIRGGFLVRVQDEGIGMTREQAARAFEKFFRVDSSHAAVEGTGLGLSITKYIVEAHGGRIWINSRKGKGATISFTLPHLTEVAGGGAPAFGQKT